ncbi:TIGR03915 family putative DNA repair protein [Kushneria sp. Sum13]|uniref:TIGR03915 family putative DNA repair protein n=1 Tax=Kushneria sp. Sum13 TaxID=3459196 RepID=UPI004045A42B
MTMYTLHMAQADFVAWRDNARRLLAARVSPGDVLWQNDDSAGDLFASGDTDLPPPSETPLALKLSRQHLRRLECASHYWPTHHQECRWALLYRVVWRLAQGEGEALLAGDSDGGVVEQRIKAVNHEVHHMHAFLRFHQQPVTPEEQHAPEFIAWFEPRHDVLEAAARHFIDRMGQHRWLIMTPEGAILCDGRQWYIERPESGTFTVQDYQALSTMEDDAEDLWLAYYASTFNPARLNEKTMVRSMPSRFWRHMPERVLITGLISHARHGARRLGQDSRLADKRGHTITLPK